MHEAGFTLLLMAWQLNCFVSSKEELFLKVKIRKNVVVFVVAICAAVVAAGFAGAVVEPTKNRKKALIFSTWPLIASNPRSTSRNVPRVFLFGMEGCLAVADFVYFVRFWLETLVLFILCGLSCSKLVLKDSLSFVVLVFLLLVQCWLLEDVPDRNTNELGSHRLGHKQNMFFQSTS